MFAIRGTLKAACLFLIGLFASSGPARAANTLKEEISSIAKEISKTLEDEKQDAIAIGEFTGPPGMNTNFGPAIEKALGDELKALKINVQKKATLSITGNMFKGDDKEEKEKLVVNMFFRVHAANGKVKAEFSAEIKNNVEIAKMLGITISLPKNGDDEVRNEKIKDQISDPNVHIEGSKVFAQKNGESAAEILVKRSPTGVVGAPRLAKAEDGQAFVGIARDEIYEIKVYNRTQKEAAVAVSIDGLDAFTFSEVKDPQTGLPKYSHFIIPAGQAVIVRGWHKTNLVADSFLVTEYGKGASLKAPVATGKTGVITLTFRSSGITPDDLPNDDGSAKDFKNLETGFGPPVKDNLQEVQRKTGKVREIISIRYSR